MTGLPAPVSEYRNYMLVIKGRSPRTVEQYELDITLFLRFVYARRSGLPEHGEEFDGLDISGIGTDFIASVTRAEAFEFFTFTVTERENNARTRARKLSALKSFYRYFNVNAGKFTENPVKDIDTPRHGQQLPKYLTLEDCVALLKCVESDTESDTRDRDYAIITLFLNCGMRLSELTGINLSTTDPELRSLKVTGKGNKERIIYLNDACRAALVPYLKLRAADSDVPRSDRDAMFLSSRHIRISPKTVQWMVYKYLRLAGLEHKQCSVHKLRHTAATLMYQSGNVDIRVLKDILGHAQLNTTQIYTHISDRAMEEAMSSNPLASVVGDGSKTKKPDDDT